MANDTKKRRSHFRYIEEEVSEDKPILMWALQFDEQDFELYHSRDEARRAKRRFTLQPSVVRVQITVLKDRK